MIVTKKVDYLGDPVDLWILKMNIQWLKGEYTMNQKFQWVGLGTLLCLTILLAYGHRLVDRPLFFIEHPHTSFDFFQYFERP